MIYYFHGNDTFSLLGRVSEIKNNFLKEHPQGIVEQVLIDGGLDDRALPATLAEKLTQAGLFESAALIIVRDLSRSIKKFPKTEEYLLKLLETGIAKDKVLIIADTVPPDKRLKFFKTLKKSAAVSEFPIPGGAELKKWIREKLKSEGFSITDEAAAKFIEHLGEGPSSLNKGGEYDLWRVSSELAKLMLYKWDEKTIEVRDVSELMPPSVPENVFALTNLFAEGKGSEAVVLLERMIGRVPDADLKNRAIMVIGALASQIRSLLLVKSFGAKKPDEIAERLEWKPSRVWVNRKLAQKFDEQKLIGMLRDLRKIDLRLKTSEEPPKLLLELFIQKAMV